MKTSKNINTDDIQIYKYGKKWKLFYELSFDILFDNLDNLDEDNIVQMLKNVTQKEREYLFGIGWDKKFKNIIENRFKLYNKSTLNSNEILLLDYIKRYREYEYKFTDFKEFEEGFNFEILKEIDLNYNNYYYIRAAFENKRKIDLDFLEKVLIYKHQYKTIILKYLEKERKITNNIYFINKIDEILKNY